VRFVFLDEGGISQREPFAVVAGVVVHGDKQLIPLELEIQRLVRKHIPQEHQDGFVFVPCNRYLVGDWERLRRQK
jgi:hypothetical protein